MHTMDKPEASLMATYARLPVSFSRGQGVHLYDPQGNAYLDALSGIAVCGLGHAHPAVSKAITEQAGLLLHTSNLYRIHTQEQLALRLLAAGGMERAFFCNSGAEANETAIKLARLHGRQRGIVRPQIAVLDGAFHGRTLATLSASGNRRLQAGFEPLVDGFVRAPFGDAAALADIAARNPSVAAVLAEPIQGESGIRIPPPGYLAELRELCDAQGWLLMLDEVQTGNGRSGDYFACQRENVVPDVITTAKGLGNGVPIGACLARGDAAVLFQPGSHASTFGGNPLAAAAALAVVNTIAEEGLATQAAELGAQLLRTLKERLSGVDGVVDVRGCGLLLGIELNRPCSVLVQRALEKRLLINVAAERVVRLLPPLIMSTAQAEQLADILCPLLTGFLAESRHEKRA